MKRTPVGIAVPDPLTTVTARQREQAERFRTEHGVEARSWYRITNAAADDEAEVMLYDEIGGWFGATADQFIADLRGVTASQLRVRVNSPGGSVFEGIAIANALRSHAANVTVQVDGIAASIASVIAMAGDRIEMAPNTMMMIHDASGLSIGTAADMAEMAELLDLISDNIADAYAARAGGSRDEWRARMRAETWYLPDDAVAAGLADAAIDMPKGGAPAAAPDEEQPDEPEMRRCFDPAAYGYRGPVQPEKPKPTPPAAAAGGVGSGVRPVGEDSPCALTTVPTASEATLTIPIGAALGEQLAEALRAAVTPVPEPQPAEAEATAVNDPAPEEPASAAEPEPADTDAWQTHVSHLTHDDADTWSAHVSHLTETTASSSAATHA